MTYATESAKYGATSTSWDDIGNRSFFRRLADKYPDLTQDELFKKVLIAADVDQSSELHVSVWKYWFKNQYLSWFREKSCSPRYHRRPKEQVRREVDAAKGKIKLRAAGMVLMDLIMPNGKPLRDCTGRECGKFGGWQNKILAKIGATGVVGKKLSEADLHKLLKSG